MSKEGVVKRKFIPQNIIEELNAKYPQECEENGISYKIDLKYITFDPNEDITARMRAYDSEIGFGMMNVIFYFATEMIKDGYRTKYDQYEYADHINTCSSKYHVPTDKVHKIVQFLISCKYFFVITDNENKYLTTCQAIYDYERCMHTRTENRKRKAKSREKYKQLQQNNSIATHTTSQLPQPLPPSECPPQTCSKLIDGYPCTSNEEIEYLNEIVRQHEEEEKAFEQLLESYNTNSMTNEVSPSLTPWDEFSD